MSWRGYVVLLASALLVPLLVDADRPWKAIQQEGLEARRARLLARLDALAASTADAIRFHEQAVVVARDGLEARSAELADLERQRIRLARQLEAAERRLAAARRAGDPDAILDARVEVESYTEVRDQRQQRLDALHAERIAAEAELAEVRRPLRELAAELESIERGRRWRLLPVVGRLAPSLTVDEITPTAVRPRVDRCTTCHLGALTVDGVGGARDGWRRAVYGPHPRPDLVGPEGSHAITAIGCTACHGGDGRSTDFERAGHRPRTAVQAARWHERWGWREGGAQADGGAILAGDLAQAGCVTCHGDAVWIADAPTQAAGRRVVAELGCAGCHVTGRPDLDDAPLAGPSLVRLPHATSRSALVARLDDPEDRFWRTWGHAADDPLTPLRDRVVRRAVVAALFEATPVESPDASPAGDGAPGDAEAGAEHFERLGCRACHRLDEAPELAAVERLRGPDLGGLGERASMAWVESWLRDPAAWRPDTLMPDLRLDPRVAADLAAFLVADAAPEPDGVESGLDRAAVDARLLDVLRRSTTVEAAAARLDALDPEERLVALGAATVRRLGCAGCHVLPTSLDAPRPDGGDLSHVGQQLARGLDTGEIALDWPHRATSRPDAPSGPLAFETPTANPGAVARAALTQVLGWRPSPSITPPRGVEPARGEGRAVMERHGCRACHVIDESTELDFVALPVDGPPSLVATGARFRSDWLVDYLRDPSASSRRPWLGSPMPTFALDPEALDAIARSLAADAGVPGVTATATSDESAVGATERAVGQVVYEMLQCGRCHPGSGGEGALVGPEPAPDYRRARRRLRPEWVEALLLDPPTALGRGEGEGMPRIFPLDSTGQPDSSFLVGSLDAPMFQVQRARLQRLFASEAALHDYLGDPERVAGALRAHLFTLDDER